MEQVKNLHLYNQLVEEFELISAEKEIRPSTQLDQIRMRAFDLFKIKGFPTVKDEDWRFTNIYPYMDIPYQMKDTPVDRAAVSDAVSEHLIPYLDAYLLVLVNGNLHLGLSTLPSTETVLIDSVSDISNTPDFIGHLQSNQTNSAMVDVNTALFKNGLRFEVLRNQVLDKPVQILHLYTKSGNKFINPRHQVVINAGAQAEIFESSVLLNRQGTILINAV